VQGQAAQQRRDANEQLKALKKDNDISEDELYGFQEESRS